MKIIWLVQSSGVTSSQPHANINALNELGFEWMDFGLIPFTNEMTNLENILVPDAEYVLLGSTKMLNIFNEVTNISELCPYLSEEQLNLSDYYLQKLKNGIFYDIESFDQALYSKFNLPLLNKDALYLPVKDNLDTSFDKAMFIKPSRDLKAFNGGILEANVSIKDYIMSQNYQAFYIDEIAIISDLVNIQAEFRFFVVSGEVITYSYYRKNGQAFKSKEVPQNVIDVAREYAKLYSPATVFTLDIARTNDGYKIVEYNCWNSSGSYDCDLKLMYAKVQEFLK